jgi:hypothetical protein
MSVFDPEQTLADLYVRPSSVLPLMPHDALS